MPWQRIARAKPWSQNASEGVGSQRQAALELQSVEQQEERAHNRCSVRESHQQGSISTIRRDCTATSMKACPSKPY